MAKTVVGLFERYRDAQEAAQEMIDMGVSSRDISLIANDSRGEFKNIGAGSDSPPGDFSTRDSTGGTKGAEGATAGAIGGGALGGVLGLLVGVGALAIPGIGPVLAAGPLAAAIGSGAAGAVAGAGIGAASGGLLGGLAGLGIPDEDAGMYAEGVRRGGTLLTVQADDSMTDRVAEIFDRHGAVDLDERSAEWRKGGWKGFDASASPYTTQQVDTMETTRSTSAPRRATDAGETVLPVVEEQLSVGKRQVERRGVRVHTTVEEKPVEEQVNLREERVRVERRPADRPADLAGGDVFREQDFELTETAEEPVVQKTARVVEEVVVDKDVRERTETVRDTVRRQDVKVDERGSETVGASGASRATFESYDRDFRTDFKGRRIDGGYTYDQYAPVYRYGYMLANDQRYTGQDWSAIEPEARTRWEERNPGTWEQFKDSVRYAWDRVRGRA